MVPSKQVKDSFFGCGCKPESNNMLKKIYNWFKFDVLYGIYGPISKFFKSLKQSYQWAKFGWNNYDWDHYYLFDVITFKLKRMHKQLNEGFAIQEAADMDALKEAYTITERLAFNNYDEQYYDAHVTKWGEHPPFKTEPNYDSKGKIISYTLLSSKRSNVITEEDEKQEKEEYLKIYELAKVRRIADLDRLNEILKNHSETWWD